MTHDFECPNLLRIIRTAHGFTGAPEGPIYEKDLQGIEEIDAGRRMITSLEGIQHLSGLKYLLFWSNQVVDLTPLQNLTQLEILSFAWNQVPDLLPFQNLTNLKSLFFAWNQIKDICPLRDLVSLQELHFGWNQITDLATLQHLTQLRYLNLNSNQVEDLAPLVANQGIGKGAKVKMKWNKLDLQPGSKTMDQIQTLIDRGVEVDYEPQGDDMEKKG